MLIPYQPDYKDTQLKVPGTGACNTTNSCQNTAGPGFCCSQVSVVFSVKKKKKLNAHLNCVMHVKMLFLNILFFYLLSFFLYI